MVILRVEFGVEIVPEHPFKDTTALSVLAEELGFKNVFVTDHWFNRNPYVALTLMAEATESITLGLSVTNPYLVHPAVTASAIGSVAEIAKRKTILGMGAGDKITLRQAGVKRTNPVETLKEAITIVRDLLVGNRLEAFQGEYFPMISPELLMIDVNSPFTIPIYIGAQGRRMLELSAEVGDGVLINSSNTLDLRKAVETINNGLNNHNRSRDSFMVLASTCISIDPDERQARKAAKIVIAYIVSGANRAFLEGHGLNPAISERIGFEISKGEWKKAIGLVSDEMLNLFSISGTPQQIIERIQDFLGTGIDQIIAGAPLGKNIRSALNLLGREVLPSF